MKLYERLWYRWGIILILLITLGGVAQAKSLPDTLAEEGQAVKAGMCAYEEQPHVCLMVVYKEETYIVVGFVKEDDFYARVILKVEGETVKQVWKYGDIST